MLSIIIDMLEKQDLLKMRRNKRHSFTYIDKGIAGTSCGIKDRDGIIYNSGKKVTCKKCIKKINSLK